MLKLLTTFTLGLALVGQAAAHPNPTKLFHPTPAGLKKTAVIASDYVEMEGLKYIGAVGVCKAEDPAVVKSGPGFKHVRCRMRTSNGYRFLVTWHANSKGSFEVTVNRTL